MYQMLLGIPRNLGIYTALLANLPPAERNREKASV
jgi:hypothetical protein